MFGTQFSTRTMQSWSHWSKYPTVATLIEEAYDVLSHCLIRSRTSPLPAVHDDETLF